MNRDTQTAIIGSHVSTKGGVHNAIAAGERIGATAIQIFSKNQTRWVARPLPEVEAERFRRAWRDSTIRDVVVHDSYLINLGSPDAGALDKSRRAFLDEVARAEQLGIAYLVFHPGSYLNSDEAAGLRTIADSLEWVLEASRDAGVRLLLEVTAGQGTNLGYRFEQLAQIMDWVNHPGRIGVCLDTAHIFAAGYDIRTARGYDATMAEFDKVIGLKHLYVVHVNDSKKELASRVDRHERLGDGHLGLEPFRLLMNDPRLTGVPKILEIPGDEAIYKANIDLLRRLITPS